jgi:hypothetical protein
VKVLLDEDRDNQFLRDMYPVIQNDRDNQRLFYRLCAALHVTVGVSYLTARRKHEMTQQQLIEEYRSLPDEAQRQVADFVAFLRQRYKAARSMPQTRTADLETEPFIGMWRTRQDLEDSTTWVRNTRKAEWGEGA